MFLALLLFAVQLLFDLYATSAVTAAGYDAARSVAAASVDHRDAAAVGGAQRAADERARSLLGRFGGRVAFDWSGSDAATVRLRLRVEHPRVGLAGVNAALGADHLDRTVAVRVERPQPGMP